MSNFTSLIARGVVAAVHAAGRMQRLQLRLLAGEVKDEVEHLEPYGYTSHALPGAEHLTLFLDGDRSHGVAIVVADRRYRLQALPAGGVALYDNAGSSFVLNADGTVKTTAVTKVTIDCPLVEATGDLKVGGNILADGEVADRGGAKTMADMRDAYNAHQGHNLPGTTPNVSA